jgi:hypothetical protein
MVDPFHDNVPGLGSIARLTPNSSNLDVPKIDPDAANVPTIGLGSPEEARAFNLWLRKRWEDKERLLDGFAKTGRFEHTGVQLGNGSGQAESKGVVVPIGF